MLRRALLFAPSAFAFGLGTWQVQRLEEKRTEIEYRESLLGGPPLDLNSSSRSDLQRHAPVACRGRFLHDRSVYVGPRVRSELGQAFQGCMVVTPLVLDDDDSGRGGKRGGSEGGGSALSRLFSSRGTAGSEGGKGAATADGGREGGGIVLVLRGWVPQMWRSDPSRFDAMRPRESLEVQGLVKHSDKPGYFAPDNLPEIGQWFYYDIPAMWKACGLAPPGEGAPAPLLVEECNLDLRSETKKVKLSTAMDVLAFRTDRDRMRGPMGRSSEESEGSEGSPADREAPPPADAEIRRLMARLSAARLPISRTLGDFLRFNVTPQDHMNYAATWFALAAATALMAYARIRTGRNGAKQWWFATRARRQASGRPAKSIASEGKPTD